MKVQINLSDEMVEKVDSYARKFGVSRSSLCSLLIGQGIMSFDSTLSVVSGLGDKLAVLLQDALNNAIKTDIDTDEKGVFNE